MKLLKTCQENGLKIDEFKTHHMDTKKTQDFVEDSSEEFGKSQVSGLGSVHRTS